MANLATFWSGPISPLEISCLLSFAESGHEVTLFSYEQLVLPKAILLRNADSIIDKNYMSRFRTDGCPNIAHFADYFRLLIQKIEGKIWIDSDVFCFNFDNKAGENNIILKERDQKIINCVLCIRSPALLDEAIRLTEAMFDRDLPWAATQNIIPRAVKLSNYKGELLDSSIYSPINVNDWYKLLLPEYFDYCNEVCSESYSIHIYNNILQKIGFLKSALPPQGSYLYSLIINRGYNQLFEGMYPSSTVHNLVDSWRLRFSGEAIGVGSLIRQVFPSLKRTVARRRFQ